MSKCREESDIPGGYFHRDGVRWTRCLEAPVRLSVKIFAWRSLKAAFILEWKEAAIYRCCLRPRRHRTRFRCPSVFVLGLVGKRLSLNHLGSRPSCKLRYVTFPLLPALLYISTFPFSLFLHAEHFQKVTIRLRSRYCLTPSYIQYSVFLNVIGLRNTLICSVFVSPSFLASPSPSPSPFFNVFSYSPSPSCLSSLSKHFHQHIHTWNPETDSYSLKGHCQTNSPFLPHVAGVYANLLRPSLPIAASINSDSYRFTVNVQVA